MTGQDIDPEDRDYLSYNWGSLAWSEWVPFTADKHTFHEIPHTPGVYRIKPVGKDFLMYVGETGRTLHQRLNELRQTLNRSALMPWNDPYTEAPALWAWSDWSKDQEDEKNQQKSESSERLSNLEEEKSPQKSANSDWSTDQEDEKNHQESESSERLSNLEDEKNHQESESSERLSNLEDEKISSEIFEYECSAAPLDASPNVRKGMESFLLYRYRQEYGASPVCNFGRFHPRYRKSTNRKEGRRGGRLEENQKDNPAGFPRIEPLEATGKPGDPDWMGLEWSEPVSLDDENVRKISAGAGLFLLTDSGSNEIVYIGQSADVMKRLLDHSKKSWDEITPKFSYQIVGQSVLPHNLRELENDLIGNFFENYRKAPEFQFKNH